MFGNLLGKLSFDKTLLSYSNYFKLNFEQFFPEFHFKLHLELLLEVSRRITEELELYALGAVLGVKDYTIKSKLRDHAGINEASFQVLVHWKGLKEQSEIKTQLKNALCSKHVGMNNVVAELKDYF